jgi:8-oxo-dGTP pyrophosphatase MutT (NUDIX family)
MNKNANCNNCGKPGHLFSNCKMPIISSGIIAFRKPKNGGPYEFLLICRKETLGYIDFMRGKYPLNDKEYIINMMKQMTVNEKQRLLTMGFDELWNDVWGEGYCNSRYKSEESVSRDKHRTLISGITIKDEFFNLKSIIEDSYKYSEWKEPEWGFPKGRRNNNETDYDCAIREFCEESGYAMEKVKPIQNVIPYEEIFTGSNYLSYKHKYFLAYMDYNDTLVMDKYQRTEVSNMSWCSINDCLEKIRIYNLEKRRIITNVDSALKQFAVYQL